MEKERAIQCVPVELLGKLKALSSKLWEDRNPASVHLNAILEEFEPDVKSLSNTIKEYESEYSGRVAANQSKYEQKESRIKKELEDLRSRLAAAETARTETLRKYEEVKAAFNSREALIAELKIKATEDEGALNARFVARMQELYDKVNKKELDMLAQWEEKNKALEAKELELGRQQAAAGEQLRLKSKALEEEYNARKAELIKAFEKIRLDISGREQSLEREYADKFGQLELREEALEEDFNARKADLKRTFDRIRAELDARESSLDARERGEKP